MAKPESASPLLDNYVISEYRYQDQRAEQIYTRANWQMGLVAVMAGAAYSVRRTDLLPRWGTSPIVFFYAFTGLVLVCLLCAVVASIIQAVVPGRYATPGACARWVTFAREEAGEAGKKEEGQAPRAAPDERLIAELAEVTDENRAENRRRYRHLNFAAKLVAVAAAATALHLAFVGMLLLAFGPQESAIHGT